MSGRKRSTGTEGMTASDNAPDGMRYVVPASLITLHFGEMLRQRFTRPAPSEGATDGSPEESAGHSARR